MHHSDLTNDSSNDETNGLLEEMASSDQDSMGDESVDEVFNSPSFSAWTIVCRMLDIPENDCGDPSIRCDSFTSKPISGGFGTLHQRCKFLFSKTGLNINPIVDLTSKQSQIVMRYLYGGIISYELPLLMKLFKMGFNPTRFERNGKFDPHRMMYNMYNLYSEDLDILTFLVSQENEQFPVDNYLAEFVLKRQHIPHDQMVATVKLFSTKIDLQLFKSHILRDEPFLHFLMASHRLTKKLLQDLITTFNFDVKATNKHGQTLLMKLSSWLVDHYDNPSSAVGEAIPINSRKRTSCWDDHYDGLESNEGRIMPYHIKNELDQLICFLVKEVGVDINARDNSGKTAFMHCIERGTTKHYVDDCAELLINYGAIADTTYKYFPRPGEYVTYRSKN